MSGGTVSAEGQSSQNALHITNFLSNKLHIKSRYVMNAVV